MLKAGIKSKDKKKKSTSKPKRNTKSSGKDRIIKITVIKRKDGKRPGEEDDAR